MATITDQSTGNICVLFLGLLLDALPTYQNTSKSLPNVVFNLVTYNPVTVKIEGTVDFDPTKNNTIAITVSD